MSVLVINCGSSSVKFKLLNPGRSRPFMEGSLEEIGDGKIANHNQALELISKDIRETLTETGETLEAVGHRVVHGGDQYSTPALIDEHVIAAIEELAVLAPLHNPAGLDGIRAAQAAFPDIPQVAVFDTAFHMTIPEANRTYAVPREWEKTYGVRKYGFHGTSHSYVSKKAIAWLKENREIDPAKSKVVVLHLGNGASATAVLGGKSIDTSMGLTPLPGLVMGTRSGDIDPAIFGHMGRVAGLTVDQVEAALNFEGGMLALSGDSDMRVVEKRVEAGDAQARLALDVYIHRLRSTVGSYIATLGGLDALVFTAGVGENSVGVRQRLVGGLGAFGLELNKGLNAAPVTCEVVEISAEASKATVLVVPTDEEAEIADQARSLLEA